MKQTLYLPSVAAFELFVSCEQTDPKCPELLDGNHTHPECEIYINVSGDVSFMVENHIYPILPGSIIITRPYEYHHCIYRSDALHNHFCVRFSADKNEKLFPLFFNREPGDHNLLTLKHEKIDELYSICKRLEEHREDAFNRYYLFFQMMNLLNTAETVTLPMKLYPDVTAVLDYINRHFAETISVRELSDLVHVSVNTLERHFQEKLGMTPQAYLKKKRLAKAAEFLSIGSSVTEAGEQSGFSDTSGFIAQFKKAYHMTPLQYKKSLRSE